MLVLQGSVSICTVYGAGTGSLSQPDLLVRPTPWREKLPESLHLRRKQSRSPPLPRGSGIARHLCQPAVLAIPAPNLPHQSFPSVCPVKPPSGWARGRRQTPARGGGRWRSETSCFCQLPDVKSIALRNFAPPAPGGRQTWQGHARGGGGSQAKPWLIPAPPSSGEPKIEKQKIFFPLQENLGETKGKLSNTFPEQVCLAFSQNAKLGFAFRKAFAEEENGF